MKRILQEQDKYEFLNDVNADDINKMDVNVKTLDRREMYPASSDFVGEWSGEVVVHTSVSTVRDQEHAGPQLPDPAHGSLLWPG